MTTLVHRTNNFPNIYNMKRSNQERNIVAILMLAGGIVFGCSRSGEERPPNLILILADDLGYNDLGCYRYENEQLSETPPTARTPSLDRLAEQGMRFIDFYCGAAVCSPSRSALLTGRNCTRAGIYNWIPSRQPMHLRDGEVTIAELLKEKGYRTAHFGKWHLTAEGMGQPLPVDQGYETAFFTYNNAEPSHHNPVNFFRDTVAVGPLEGYSCQLVAGEAIAWLKDHTSNGESFYINVWFNEPHEKVAAPPELAARHSYHHEYYGCIENMDLAVGRLLASLEELGLTENTLVIFTSDNGSQMVASNDPLRGEKAFNYEGGIRVPFIARWPGKIPAGTVSAVPGYFADVLPTVAGLTGTALTGTAIPAGRRLDGEDLSGVLLGKEEEFSRSEPIFFFRYFHDPVCMLRDGDWVLLGFQDAPFPWQADYDQKELANLKPGPGEPDWSMWGFQQSHMEYLVDAVPRQFELYHIRQDISQREDLGDRYPELVERLRRKMLELREEMIGEGGNWYP